MKIKVNGIPDEGLSLAFDRHTPWFHDLLRQRFSDLDPQEENAGGEAELHKTMQNVSLSGEVRLGLKPPCARCGVLFETELEVPLLRNLVPYFSGREALLSDEEEVELSAEDLEFSFYRNEEIDLGEIVGEEITLAMPIRFICREDCRGLCSRCGANLNQGVCGCEGLDEFSPFSALKGLKLKS